MSQATQKLITADEFFHMPGPPDGSRQELVRGVIETMPPPGAPHGYACATISRKVGNHVAEKGLGSVFCNDTGWISERDPDTVRGPDVSFWGRERLPEVPKGYIEVAPDLVVEVVSPGDHYARIQKKVKHYLDKGVRLVWVVDPEDRSVTIYRAGRMMNILGENEALDGEDVLPEFTCRVAELFP